MSLLTPEDLEALVANAQMRAKKETTGKGFDPYPVVKLYTSDAAAFWLLTDIDPESAYLRAALGGSCYA